MAAIRPSSDVLVVGAGVVGLSIALALQERGAHVVVVERAGVAEGQSVIQPGGIRLQWGTTVNCRLALRANVRTAMRDLLPILEYVGLDVLVSGADDGTPDRQPILGPLPGHDGLHVAAGFSGHGFMIAPAVGRIVAGGIAGERDTVLDVLDSRRFQEGRTVPEPQVI